MIKERSNLVIKAKEVRIVKEVMACDVSPVAMFYKRKRNVVGLKDSKM